MSTIFDLEGSSLSAESKHLKLPVSVPRESPTKWVYQQDQFKLFKEQDKIKSFVDINSTLTPGYTFQKYNNLVVFYRLGTVLNVTEVTDCVRVVDTSMLSCFTRVHLYLYHSGFITEETVILVQYSRRAQKAQIQEKKNIIVKCYSIFTSSTL